MVDVCVAILVWSWLWSHRIGGSANCLIVCAPSIDYKVDNLWSFCWFWSIHGVITHLFGGWASIANGHLRFFWIDFRGIRWRIVMDVIGGFCWFSRSALRMVGVDGQLGSRFRLNDCITPFLYDRFLTNRNDLPVQLSRSHSAVDQRPLSPFGIIVALSKVRYLCINRMLV